MQTPEGDWYSIMFQDYHSVGRIPVLVPLVWGDDGWPVFGNEGKSVPQVLPVPVPGHEKKSIVESDEFDNTPVRNIYDEAKKNTEITAGIPADELEQRLDSVEENEFGYNGSNLKLVWQWNHNPNNNLWSLTERDGYLRLKSGLISKNIRTARNTLTQRTYGPTSGASTAIEVSHMRDGDVAGLAAFQNQYSFVGIKMEDGAEQERVELTQDRVYLKVNCDYRENKKSSQTWRMKDEAYFYYSLDGENWTQLGDALKMSYDWPDFMGYRFGLFYYSTLTRGGYVDFDYFHIASVDGKKAELATCIKEAESLQRQPYHTEDQWARLTGSLSQAKTAMNDLPDEESELSLPDIEQNNRDAYLAIEQLTKVTAEIRAAGPSDPTDPSNPADPSNPSGSAAPSTPADHSVPFAGPGASPAPGTQTPPGTVAGGVKSRSVTVKAAGYPFTGKGISVVKGSKVRLQATVLPADAAQKSVTYSSNKKKVASVSAKGILSARKPGSAKITVTAKDSGAKTVIKVNVVKKKKANRVLKAAKKSAVIKTGQSIQFKIKKITAKTTTPVIYKSANKQIAAIDPYGTITGKKKGTVKIRAICGNKSATMNIEVQ